MLDSFDGDWREADHWARLGIGMDGVLYCIPRGGSYRIS